MEWNALIGLKRGIPGRRENIAYPYVISKRAEHGDLLAINDLVPHAYPPDMRADICQSMMLAVLEGDVTIDEIKANRDKSAWFLRKFWRDNYEASGRAAHLDTVGEDRLYDEIAASVALKDWHHEQVADRHRYGDALRTFQPPTQFEHVYARQVRSVQGSLEARGA